VGRVSAAGVQVRARLLLAILLLGVAGTASAAETVMVVYLPAAPIESASRLGDAVTELGSYLSGRVPGLSLTVRPFRRGEDATSYIESSTNDVALLVCDASFLLDLPNGFAPVPTHRLVRGGKETHRKVVVVGTASTAKSLADLKGKSLSLAVSGGTGSSRFLSRAVFDGEVAADSWFGKILPEADEFTATANVLFGRADAGLVSEDNPLLVSHLGKELRTIYTSPGLSYPVVAFRGTALSAEQQSALETALDGLARHADGKKILDRLRLDGIARIKEGSGRLDRAGLLSLPADERRTPEVATVSLRDLALAPLPPPSGGKLPLLVGFTLPELPMPVLEASK
jgi:ABC-type phosphate/phosphonate transport system substrate-binding protein